VATQWRFCDVSQAKRAVAYAVVGSHGRQVHTHFPKIPGVLFRFSFDFRFAVTYLLSLK
jgi:hypothetical protein